MSQPNDWIPRLRMELIDTRETLELCAEEAEHANLHAFVPRIESMKDDIDRMIAELPTGQPS